MPFKEGLAFAYDALLGFDLKKDIKLFASGKIVTGFHIFRAMALGADACYSARAMMMALGCIQALECNKNTCPTGVTTHNKELMKGLVVNDKKQRVANFQKETIKGFVELLAATGFENPARINRTHIYRRSSLNRIRRFDDIYPYVPKGSLLNEATCPLQYKEDLEDASADSFLVNAH